MNSILYFSYQQMYVGEKELHGADCSLGSHAQMFDRVVLRFW